MPEMTIDLTKVIVALIGLLSTVITCWLVPWIKANTTVKQQQILRGAVQTAVFAAEQIYGADKGQEKYEYVVNWLKEHGFEFDKADVEAAVFELLNASGIVIEAPSLTAKVGDVEVK